MRDSVSLTVASVAATVVGVVALYTLPSDPVCPDGQTVIHSDHGQTWYCE